MNISKFILVILSLFALLSSGCLEYNTLIVYYRIASDLTGEVSMTFKGLSSDGKTRDERIKEMRSFYDGKYLEYLNDLKTGEHWMGRLLSGMDSLRVEFAAKTDTSCDAIVSGKIRWFPNSLASFVSSEEDDDDGKWFPFFTMQQIDDFLSATIGINTCDVDVDVDDSAFIFILEYDDDILAHNAHEYDEDDNVLRWKFDKHSKNEPQAIHFVLHTDW